MMQGPPTLGEGPRGRVGVQERRQAPRFGLGTFASLRIAAYRIYFGALLGQMGAMNMQMVASSWFMYELTGRASLLGAVALANAAPMLALSLFGGVLADRMRKKNIMMAGQMASTLVALGIALSITLGSITWVHLIVASFFQGIIMALMMPARQAVISELVGRESLMNAVALNAAAMNLLRLLAPAVAGFLIALWSIEGAYYIISGLHLVGFLFVLRLPITGVVEGRKSDVLGQLGDGLVYIRRNGTILALLVFTLVATVLSMPYFFLLPAFTKDILTVDPASLGGLATWPLVGGIFASLGESSARLGLLISISGVGALVASLAVASMPNRRRGLLYLLSALLMGATLVAFSLTSSYWLAFFVFIPLGLAQAGRMALSNILVQTYTEDAYLGRVLSIYMMEWGMTNVGVFVVGILAEFTGVQWAVGGAAGLLVAATLAFLALSPRLRRLD